MSSRVKEIPLPAFPFSLAFAFLQAVLPCAHYSAKVRVGLSLSPGSSLAICFSQTEARVPFLNPRPKSPFPQESFRDSPLLPE